MHPTAKRPNHSDGRERNLENPSGKKRQGKIPTIFNEKFHGDSYQNRLGKSGGERNKNADTQSPRSRYEGGGGKKRTLPNGPKRRSQKKSSTLCRLSHNNHEKERRDEGGG